MDHEQEEKDHIKANHVDMCRFKDKDDPEYRKVRDALGSYMKLIEDGHKPGL